MKGFKRIANMLFVAMILFSFSAPSSIVAAPISENIEEIETQKNKRAKGFKITPAGKKFAKKILERFDGLINVAIKPKLTICAHCGVQLYGNYHTEEMDGKEMNFCCKHCAMAYKQHMRHS